MVEVFYYKITVRLKTNRIITIISEHYTRDKKILEYRWLEKCKKKYKDDFSSLDIWELPKDHLEVRQYINQKPLL